MMPFHMAIVSELTLRVRYAETDRMGIVHHARFLEYLEVGRVELLRISDLCYRGLEARGIFFPVTELWVRYRRPLTFDDELRLTTWYRDLTRTRVTFGYRLRGPDGEISVEALTMHAQVDEAGRPAPIDEVVATIVQANLSPDDVTRSRLRQGA